MRSITSITFFTIGFLLSIYAGLSFAFGTYCVETTNGYTVRTDLVVDASGNDYDGDKSGFVYINGRLSFYGGTFWSHYDDDAASTDDHYCDDWGYDTVTLYPNEYVPPTATNGVQDPNEDGIDCGGDTGVDCVSRCPDGYTLTPDGQWCRSDEPTGYDRSYLEPPGWDQPFPWPYLEGWPLFSTVPALDASPDTSLEPDDFGAPSQAKDDPDSGAVQVASDDGDYIVFDSDGNIVDGRTTGDSTTTDNGDGTLSVVSPITIYNPDGTTSEATQTDIVDAATGDVVSSGTTTPASTGSTVLYGGGSSSGVTGDQFSNGIDKLGKDIGDALGVDPDGDEGGNSYDLGNGDGDFDGVISDDDMPTEDSIPDLLNDFLSNSPITTVFTGSGVEVQNTSCSVSTVVYGRTITFSFCNEPWPSTLAFMSPILIFCSIIASYFIVIGRD